MRWVGFLFALIVFVCGVECGLDFRVSVSLGVCKLRWRLDGYVVWRWRRDV